MLVPSGNRVYCYSSRFVFATLVALSHAGLSRSENKNKNHLCSQVSKSVVDRRRRSLTLDGIYPRLIMAVKVKWKCLCVVFVVIFVEIVNGMFIKRHCSHLHPKPDEVQNQY